MVRIRLLGGLAIEVDGAAVDPPASARGRALLGWLALHPGMHPRAQLAGRLRPDVLEESARLSLRQAVLAVRRSLGPAGARCLAATRDAVGLVGDGGLWIDAGAFAALVAAGRLEEALELARGELLKGADDDWALEARDEHRRALTDALGRLAADAEAGGRHADAVRWTRRQLAADPRSEDVGRDLVRRLALAGDRPAALAAYEALHERLRRDLGIAPSAATRALVERVRAGLVAAGPPAARTTPPLPPRLRGRAGDAFVGRERPLERLRGAWRAARGGDLSLALVTGEPGIGKTALAGRLGRELHVDGATVLYGRCDEEALVPYQPFVEALGHHVESAPEEELRERLAGCANELQRLLPGLARRLPDLPPPLPGAPESERFRLLDATATAIAAAAGQRPVLLVLDDLHWADRPTLLMLSHLLRSAAASSLLIVGCYRDTEVPANHPLRAALAGVHAERVALGGLDEQEVGALIAARAGRATAPPLARALRAETHGNPFFVEEVIRHLGERVPDWAAADSLALEGVPPGIRDVVATRLARLGGRAVEVLTAGAIMGPEFDLEALEQAAGPPADEVLAGLERALTAGLVVEAAGGVGRYGFTHALVRDTLLAELSTARRMRLHAAIGVAIERLGAGDAGPRVAEAARHFAEAAPGGDVEKAVAYAVRAARRATAMLAHEEAAEHYERGLDVLRLVDEGEARRCELLVAAGEAHNRAGSGDRARAAFAAAAQLARGLGRTDLLAGAALGYGGLAVTIWSPDETLVGMLREALALLPGDQAELRARLLGRLAVELYYTRDPAGGDALSREAVETARRAGSAATLAHALTARRVTIWSPEHARERLEVATEIVELARQAGDAEAALQGRNWRVVDLLDTGDIEGVDAEIAAYAHEAAEVRLPAYFWYVPLWRSMRATMAGRFEEGARLTAEARWLGQRAQDRNAELFTDIQRLHTLTERGAFEEVDVAWMEALAARSPAQAGAWRPWIGWVNAELGRRDAARADLQWMAADDFAELPRDANWHVALELAELVAALGDAPRAERLHDLLAPHAELTPAIARAVGCYGSVSYFLGRLAATSGRWELAARHLEQALRVNARLGARPRLAWTRLRHAQTLAARGGRGDRERARAGLDAAAAAASELGMDRLLAEVEGARADGERAR